MKSKINKIISLSTIVVFTLVFALIPNTVYGSAPLSGGKVSVSDFSIMITLKSAKTTIPSNKIEVLSYSYGVISPRDAASGLPTGKRMHKPFVIIKELDKSSPLLMKLLITDEVLPEVTLSITNSKTKDIYNITLKNVRVSSILSNSGLDGDSSIGEEITLDYQSVSWSWGASNSGSSVTDVVR